MSENLSIQDLFKVGITREQFLAQYSTMQENKDDKESSIFTSEFANSINMAFDTINTNKNDTLDEDEIKTLMAMGKNDDVNTLSNNDLKELYNVMLQNIKNSYTSTDTQTMYNNANQNIEQVSSTYIQDLSTQIDVLLGLVSLRQNNSTSIVNSYQTQIDDLIFKNTELGNDFKTEYKQISDKLKTLPKESNKIQAELQAKAQEIERATLQAAIIKQELSQLNPENDKETITTKQKELTKLNRHIEDLSNEHTALINRQTEITRETNNTSANLRTLTNSLKEDSKNNKSRINELQAQIHNEEQSAKKDIEAYQSEIKILQDAQSYAVTQLKTNSSQTEDISSFHNNDNLMNFNELSKLGLKYSSEKGQKLAQEIRSHAVGFTGYCSRYVSNALSRSGLGNERAASAHMMDTKLENNNNFKEIKINSQADLKKLPAGCIIVYEAGAARYNAKHGHIEVSLGNGTAASDGVTRNVRYSENMSVFVPVESA